MNVDKILTAVILRILNDKNIIDETDLLDILGELKGNKGAKKPTGATNPYFTVNNMPVNNNSDTTAKNGTILISCFVDNLDGGIADTQKLGEVGSRLEKLFDDKPLEIEGYTNYNLEVNSISNPQFDPDDPEEHFITVRLGFNIIKK